MQEMNRDTMQRGQGDGLVLSHSANGLRDLVPLRQNGTKPDRPPVPSPEVRIAHLYPDLLNLYGDRGNIICLQKRCQWRGIKATVKEYSLDDEVRLDEADILFLGGGSDREQRIVAGRLLESRDDIHAYVEDDGVLVAICGGYQLIGHYYQLDGERIEGLALVDAYTVAGPTRLIGNVVLQGATEGLRTKIVGFENHAGRTHIGAHTPLGTVVHGFGNNGEDGTEGILYKNVVGTYLHGPVFPKNPALADLVIEKALTRRYGGHIALPPLDDGLEDAAHAYIVNRFPA